eukprot:SAG11_NODE_1879_length_4130_cov_3.133466_5_plen_68_part_00
MPYRTAPSEAPVRDDGAATAASARSLKLSSDDERAVEKTVRLQCGASAFKETALKTVLNPPALRRWF